MPYDLSKLTDKDLDHISKGNYRDVSDEGMALLAAQQTQQSPNYNPHNVASNIEQASNKLKDATMNTPLLKMVRKGVDSALSPENITGVLAQGYPAASMSQGVRQTAEDVGLTKAPDKLMQSAVGMKKYVPGVGNTLADEGIVGTTGMMQKQIADKLASRGSELSDVIENLPGKVSSEDVASKVGGAIDKFKTPEGIIPESVQPEVSSITKRASDIASRGEVSPKEALALKRIAQGEGYKAGEPLANLNSKLAQSEASGYGKALEDLYSQAHPDEVNKVADVNSKLAALLKGNKAVNASESPSNSSLLLKLFSPSKVMGAITGGSLGHTTGAITGYLGATAAESPLVKSAAAQGLLKGGRAVSSPAALESILAALKNQSEPDNK